MLATFAATIWEQCKIRFVYFKATSQKDVSQGIKWTWRGPTGDQYRKIFRNIDLTPLFPNNPTRAKELQRLWSGFFALFKRINTSDREKIKRVLAEGWQEDMTAWTTEVFGSATSHLNAHDANYKPPILPSQGITHYIHLYRYHVAFLLKLHGELHSFSCQQQEGLNQADGATLRKRTSGRETVNKEILTHRWRTTLNSAQTSKDKPKYLCVCRKAFTRKGDLNNHEKTCLDKETH
jgi:hypothetical protein